MLKNSCSFCIYPEEQKFKIHDIQVLRRLAFNTGISCVVGMLLSKDSLANVRGQKVRFVNGQLWHVQRIKRFKGAGVLSMRMHGMHTSVPVVL